MNNILMEMEGRRIKACTDFCEGVSTEALQSRRNLPAILRVLTEIAQTSHDAVARALAQSITNYVGD